MVAALLLVLVTLVLHQLLDPLFSLLSWLFQGRWLAWGLLLLGAWLLAGRSQDG